MIRFKATTSLMLVAGLLFGAAYSHAQSDSHAHPTSAIKHSSSLGIPKPMQVEHNALHSDLAQLTKAGGLTGEAAQAVAHVLDHHFENENEYALLPLGLLVQLSEGKFDCDTVTTPITLMILVRAAITPNGCSGADFHPA